MSLQATIRLGYGVVALLAAGVGTLGVLDWRQHQTRAAARGPAEDAVAVTITANACEPASLTVPAGPVTFRVLNRSDRVLEWEILDGVMVVEERENITPGLSQRVRARLAPGEYAITCGLLSNPRGRLTVLPAAAGAAPRAPDLRELIAPMAEYQVYLTLEGAELSEATDRLLETVNAGRDAMPALAQAHAAYEHLRPATRLLWADLDAALDARPGDYAGGAGDPGFTGFQRLALSLASGDSRAPALARRIQADTAALLARLKSATVPPDRMLAGAAVMVSEAADTPDPALARAMLEGAAKVADLLQPPIRRLDPDRAGRMAAGFTAARAALDGELEARRRLLRGLAEALSELRGTLGLA